jgi:hypothetical protein
LMIFVGVTPFRESGSGNVFFLSTDRRMSARWRVGLRYRHNWADLLRLVDDLRRLAHDRTLDDADRARRIRDRFGEHDGRFDDDR